MRVAGAVFALLLLGAPALPSGVTTDELVAVRMVDVPVCQEARVTFAGGLLDARRMWHLDMPELDVRVYWTPGDTGAVSYDDPSGCVLWGERPVWYEMAAGDPYWPRQWNMRLVDLEGGWRYSQGSGSVVAILDTGVYCRHDDIECLHGEVHYDAIARRWLNPGEVAQRTRST